MALLAEALGARLVPVTASDPLGRPVDCHFALAGETAIVEMAQASGLGRVAEHERDAWAASTRGTGELILAAVAAGAREILVAVGGSATTDGGRGAIEAIRAGGGLRGARLAVLCDVRRRRSRTRRASSARRRAPTRRRSRGSRSACARLAAELPRDPRGVPATGAAGGLSGGLWAAFGAELRPGAATVLDALGVDERMRAARLVVAGEGCLDEQSLGGKVVGELARRARGGRRAGPRRRRDEPAVAEEAARRGHRSASGSASTLEEIEAAGLQLGRAVADA